MCAFQKADLPRGDVSDIHRILWTGSKKSYAAKHAALLTMRRLRMSYTTAAKVLQLLKQCHPLYADVKMKRFEECEWKSMQTSIQVIRGDRSLTTPDSLRIMPDRKTQLW